MLHQSVQSLNILLKNEHRMSQSSPYKSKKFCVEKNWMKYIFVKYISKIGVHSSSFSVTWLDNFAVGLRNSRLLVITELSSYWFMHTFAVSKLSKWIIIMIMLMTIMMKKRCRRICDLFVMHESHQQKRRKTFRTDSFFHFFSRYRRKVFFVCILNVFIFFGIHSVLFVDCKKKK